MKGLAKLAPISLLILLAACSGSEQVAPKYVRAPGAPKIGKPYEVNGKWYTPKADPDYDEIGVASWYGPGFHGKYTASGEVYDQNGLTAAHTTLPLPTAVMVTNLENGRQLQLKVNDRGPFVDGRIIDVTKKAAQLLEFRGMGTARVRVQLVKDDGSLATRTKKGMPEILYARNEDPGNLTLGSNKLPDLAPPTTAAGSQAGGSRFTPKPGQATTAGPAPVVPTQIPGPTPLPPLPGDPQPSWAATQTTQQQPPQPPAADPGLDQQEICFIQIGSFGDEAKAQRFAGQMAALGNVTVTAVPASGMTLYRVRLGPFTSRIAAEGVLPDVQGQGFPDAMLVSGR